MIRPRLQYTNKIIPVLLAFFAAIPLVPVLTLAQQAPHPDLSTFYSSQADEAVDPNLTTLKLEQTTPLAAVADLVTAGDRPNTAYKASERSSNTRIGELSLQASKLLASTTDSPVTAYNIPIVIDPNVQRHIRYFDTSIRTRFEQWLIRLSRYRPLVEEIFAEFELPSDLVNLSLVESGFNPHARSRAKATGPWQFMWRTGKLYGVAHR